MSEGLPSLKGRTALVTGGNRGIGLEIADGLIALGAEVTILARDATQGDMAAQALGAHLAVGDLEDPASLTPLLEGPGFDILVNNAGVLPAGKLSEAPEGYFQCMAVMAHAPFLLTRAFGPIGFTKDTAAQRDGCVRTKNHLVGRCLQSIGLATCDAGTIGAGQFALLRRFINVGGADGIWGQAQNTDQFAATWRSGTKD